MILELQNDLLVTRTIPWESVVRLDVLRFEREWSAGLEATEFKFRLGRDLLDVFAFFVRHVGSEAAPSITLLDEGFVALPLDLSVFILNYQKKAVVCKVTTDSPANRVLRYCGHLLIVAEIDLYLARMDGQVVWKNSLSDVIVDCTLKANEVLLQMMEGGQEIVSLPLLV